MHVVPIAGFSRSVNNQVQVWRGPARRHRGIAIPPVQRPNLALDRAVNRKRFNKAGGNPAVDSCSDLPEPSSGSSSCEGGKPVDSDVIKVDLALPRRSRLVTFTCNKCDGRTERLVNPRAWDKGLVFLQCSKCEAWHKLKDNAGLIEEVRFSPEE